MFGFVTSLGGAPTRAPPAAAAAASSSSSFVCAPVRGAARNAPAPAGVRMMAEDDKSSKASSGAGSGSGSSSEGSSSSSSPASSSSSGKEAPKAPAASSSSATAQSKGSSSSGKEAPSTSAAPSSSPMASQPLQTSANQKLGQVTMARRNKVGDPVRNSFRQIESYRVPQFPVPGKADEVARRTERMYSILEQIFGHGYRFGADAKDLEKLKSTYTNGEIGTKEFVRSIGKSDPYRERFWENRPPFGRYGAVELAFKHFLGRNCDSAEESRAKQAVYHAQGYEAMIDSFFDDGEYDRAFNFSSKDVDSIFQGGGNRGGVVVDVRSNLSMKTAANQDYDLVPYWRELNRYKGRRPETMISQPGMERATGGERFKTLAEFKIRLGHQNNGVTAGGSPPQDVNLKNAVDAPVYRVVTAGYRESQVNSGKAGTAVGRAYRTRNGFSSVARSQRTYLVASDEMTTLYQKVTKNGGRILSVEKA